MDHTILLETVKFARGATLSVVGDVSETEADAIPNGFRNNIRWHLGHIYVVQENMMFGLSKLHRTLPEGYLDWFNRGTSPADWKTPPVSLDVLKEALRTQTDRIVETFHDKLDQPLVQPFELPGLVVTKVGELLNFSVFHEGQHMGIIKGLKYALKG